MELQVVCEGLDFPEGPVALADGSLLLVEVRLGQLKRVSADGGVEVLTETGGGPNGAAIGPDGAVWIANNGGIGMSRAEHPGGSIQRYDLKSGELTTVYEACDGRRLSAPNDLVFDSTGGFWFTDIGHQDAEARTHGALYYARTDGKAISRQRSPMLTPNGVGLSPDERTLYVADTDPGRLWAIEITAPGQLAPPAGYFDHGRVVGKTPDNGRLDSLAVEAGGKVCVATLNKGGVTVFDPDGTQVHVPAPDFRCTNLCFGGADMRDVWITGLDTGRLFRGRWPRPGLRLAFNA
jgi:gluconolactonase